MTASERIVADYLDRLYERGRDLTRTQIEELMGDVREHVAAAVLEAGRDDEATVRTVLDRLGTPDEIVAAALGDAAATGRAPAFETTKPNAWTWREIAASVLLLPGAFLAPVVAPAAGMALAASSEVWDRSAKKVAYVIGSVAVALPLLLFAVGVSVFMPIFGETRTVLTQAQTAVSEGNVLSGTSVTYGSIPNIAGMTADEAEMTIRSAGYTVSKRYEKAEGTEIGSVISMDPLAGTEQPLGTSVRLTISIG